MSTIFTVVFFVLLSFVYCEENYPKIKIDQGILQGKYQQTFKGRTFSAFTGIPYAKPPIGELRFKRAVPAESWEGVLDATKSHPTCPQINVYLDNYVPYGEEDCLYLNVYTPQLSNSEKELLPVIFFIHGGGFMNGKSDWYGPEILLDKDVIFVTTNYRVGALGFITTEDEVVPGNNGLKDQNLALRWTKNNIKQFGGDSNKITVFGQSAGGASAHYHTLSPLSKDLISGAIINSGTALGCWSFGPKGEGVKNTKKLAKLLDCPISSSLEMIECLRKVNATKIVEQDKEFMEYSYHPMVPFKPVIEPDLEGAFLIEDPINIIKSGKAANVPIMTGLTSEDGALVSKPLYSFDLIEELDRDFNRVVPFALQYHETTDKKNDVSKKIREFYFENRKIDETTKDEVTNMFTDAWFLIPEDSAARLHHKYINNPVYYFLFSYRGSISFADVFGKDPYDFGVCHCDELLYLIKFSLFFPDYKPIRSDRKMIDIMTSFWENFAKTGDPNPDESIQNVDRWEPVRSEKLEYYNIKNYDNMKMEENMYEERVNFWRSLPIDSERNKIKDEL